MDSNKGGFKMNKVKFILKPKYTDLNGNISEAGDLTIANEAIQKIFDSIGLIEIFLAEKIGPIIFDTQLHFKKEAMAGGIKKFYESLIF